jgi:predicted transcriptional regulator
MSRGAVSVDEKLTLRSVAAVLAELDIGVALVRQPDGAIGVVSERDVLHALADGADPEEVWAADVEGREVVFADPDETILAVAELMASECVRHVVVAAQGMIVGVASARDVLPMLTSYARSTI